MAVEQATLGSNRIQNVLSVKRRDGFYRLTVDGEERKFVSVTTVLKVLGKPALVGWAAKQGMKAVLENPEHFSSTEKWSEAVYGPRDKAANRGSTVHSAIEAVLNGAESKPIYEGLPPDEQQRFAAFLRWRATVPDLEVIHSETTLYSTEHGYAGTTDLLCSLGGRRWLVDFKTGKYIYPEVSLQLAAYRACDLMLPKTEPCPQGPCEACANTGRQSGALQPFQRPEVLGVLLLKDNGRYQFEEVEAPLEVFLALQRVWRWQKEMD